MYLTNILVIWSVYYLRDVCFDALGQFDAGLSKKLRQLVWDVLVFVQSIQ